jgi:hypothetical protein
MSRDVEINRQTDRAIGVDRPAVIALVHAAHLVLDWPRHASLRLPGLPSMPEQRGLHDTVYLRTRAFAALGRLQVANLGRKFVGLNGT